MKPPCRLLAATDLSASSRHAAQRAALLAGQTQGSVELLHVLETSVLDELRRLLGDKDAGLAETIASQAREALAQLALDIAHTHGVLPTTQLVQGSVLETIAARAEKLDADLLVVGARGAGYLRQWLLGATGERLLRKTTRPILFVRQAPHTGYRRILVPVDFSPWSAKAIAAAIQLDAQAHIMLHHASALPFEGKMRFAGVDEESILQYRQAMRREALAQLQQLATQAGLATEQWQGVVTQGDPAHDILEQQEESDADLIVLGKHGAGVTGDLLLGSVTQQVLGQARSDVLVVTH